MLSSRPFPTSENSRITSSILSTPGVPFPSERSAAIVQIVRTRYANLPSAVAGVRTFHLNIPLVIEGPTLYVYE